jgi:hypothetical protein
MAHEFGHQLASSTSTMFWRGPPVAGVFSLMDSGDSQFGEIANQYEEDRSRGAVLPASLDPFHRLVFSRIVRLTEATPGDTLTAPLPGVLLEKTICSVPVHIDESFVVENRPPITTGTDRLSEVRLDDRCHLRPGRWQTRSPTITSTPRIRLPHPQRRPDSAH